MEPSSGIIKVLSIMFYGQRTLACDVHHSSPLACHTRRAKFREFMSTGRVTTRDDLANPVVQLQRILVATDFSAGACAALDCALSMARRYKGKIFLVHWIPLLQYVAPVGCDRSFHTAKKIA